MSHDSQISVGTSSTIKARPRWAKHPLRLLATGAALALMTACTSGGSSDGALNSDEQSAVPITDGGQVVIGAEQEPDCLDPIGTCGGSIWGSYIMSPATLPGAFTTRKDGEHWVPQASDLMESEPTSETVDGKQTITYKIDPKAVWSDDEPITSADFKYTALEIRDGNDIMDKTGYDKIASISTPDAHTAVVTLKESYASWKYLFVSVLPAHILEGKNRNALMKDGYPWSGGPWLFDGWKRGTSITLKPNPNYWGEKPHLDQATFQFIPDTAAAFQALKSGEVDAMYPSPQLEALDQVKAGIPNTKSQVTPESGSLEAIWLNNTAFPFDSTAVRQALAYSIDRGALVERIFGEVGVEEPAQSFFTPILDTFGDPAFDTYTLDLDQVDELMSGDGWSKGDDGIWAKGGKPAQFTIETLAGDKRRDLELQIVQSQLKDAGFDMRIHGTTPADLFAKTAPSGNFQAALYTLIDVFPEPLNLSATYATSSIPTKANGFSGINFGRVEIDGLDPLLQQLDSEVDETKRVDVSQQIDQSLADAVPAIPMVAVPNVLLWSDRLGGPISINPSEGPFWNLNQWGVAK